jgi:hypothetical protein
MEVDGERLASKYVIASLFGIPSDQLHVILAILADFKDIANLLSAVCNH